VALLRVNQAQSVWHAILAPGAQVAQQPELKQGRVWAQALGAPLVSAQWVQARQRGQV
jgi:hypothetical protein